MGRGRGGKRGFRGRGGFGGNRPRPDNRTDKASISRHNDKFEHFYDSLGIVPNDDKEEFWEYMRKDLPNSFRFTGSRSHALAVQQRLIDFYIPEITSITFEGQYVHPPRPITWYPDKLAWDMTTPKQVIRRFKPFSSFQKFLVAETDVGNINRQEIVSMIPPLVMDLKPGMTVLDMCAAPGSKSAQLIEMIHAGEEERSREVAAHLANGLDRPDGEDNEDDGRSTGLLIANDVDYKRAHMLVHQMKRLASPNIIVTNHDATIYPSIKIPSPQAEEGKQPQNRYLKFDRILADVPCSGDGTPRKNVEIWSKWSPANGLGLHMTQVRILIRALQMLKVGGRVVYSTCSMNPVEDEAVLAAAIDRCGGPDFVELIETKDLLPGLKRYPGMKNWSIMDKSGRLWDSWESVTKQRDEHGDDGLGRLQDSMFAPNNDLPLDRAMRIYPHQQDTGAFFIAILEKKAEIKARSEEKTAIPPQKAKFEAADSNGVTAPIETRPNGELESPKRKRQDEDDADAGRSKKPKKDQPFEEPFKYLDSHIPELDMIFDFYNISSRFPRDRFMVRNAQATATKNIYYTTALAKSILQENEGKGMKFVHSGVKMFVKQDAPAADVCPWRIQTDGLRILETWVGPERIIVLTKRETLRKLLIEMFPRFHGEDWKNLAEIGEAVLKLRMGCCVLVVQPTEEEDGFAERMVFPLWKSVQSLNLMLPKEERRAMLLRLFNDDTPLINPMGGRKEEVKDQEKVVLKVEESKDEESQEAADRPHGSEVPRRNSSSPEVDGQQNDKVSEDEEDEGGMKVEVDA